MLNKIVPATTSKNEIFYELGTESVGHIGKASNDNRSK